MDVFLYRKILSWLMKMQSDGARLEQTSGDLVGLGGSKFDK